MYKFALYIRLLLLFILEVFHTAQVVPTVVWWTSKLYPYFTDVSHISCLTTRCVSTSKKLPSSENETIAFLFYGTDFDPEDLPLPRKSNHVWALLHEESPMNNFMFSHSVGIQLFNYTSTFSRHSDYPLTTQFLPALDYLTERDPVPTSVKNKLRSKGFAPVLYVQSHCNIASDRDRYVEELMKYIDIDSFGTCLHNKDLPGDLNTTDKYESKLFLDFISQYKFHITFENAICDDYITEKLFRTLHVGSVPIYRGSPSVKDWEPSENSIIIADNFKTPKALAAFVTALDQNDISYDKYLNFKKNITNHLLKRTLLEREWGINHEEKLDFIRGFECFICDSVAKLKRRKDFTQSLPKVADKTHMNCQQPRPSIESESAMLPNDKWMKEDWIESYWFAFDQARAIRKMIENNEKNSASFYKYLMKLKYNH